MRIASSIDSASGSITPGSGWTSTRASARGGVAPITATFRPPASRITLSRNQVEWATEHYPGCEFEYLNYENIEGEYDRIVCVGLAEHVKAFPEIASFRQKLRQLEDL